MKSSQYTIISGEKNGLRIESRVLEEQIQNAVAGGQHLIEVQALGQHGIGGRLWRAGDEQVVVRISGHSGQRVGAMGFPNTVIEAMGPCSDDAGWLNGGAEIIIHGHAANGIANAMAQGRIYVDGNIGARGMTMTKRNPRFAPPELWVLGSAGDYFGEFMAGGIAVICGHEPQNDNNVLGYRPLVGMVGGKVFFRGPHKGYSQADAKAVPIDRPDWQWLQAGLKTFLEKIGKPDLLERFANPEDWQLLMAKTPQEKTAGKRLGMTGFRQQVWEKELGAGGLIGDLTSIERSPIPVITTGELRRYVPEWENRKYLAPCQSACPTGIPVEERWRLIREGRIEEAVDLALAYTPFPATICGYLCPNLCMQSCSRQIAGMMPVDIRKLGQASLNARIDALPEEKGRQIAVIGGGPAGLSVAWHLRRQGYTPVVYDRGEKLGGKLTSVIPESRIPQEVLSGELERLSNVVKHVHLKEDLTAQDFSKIRENHAYTVIAVGARTPMSLPVPGKERMITALDFLEKAKTGNVQPGKRVVIIGAGNVGCDVATEAARLGAEDITLLDVQKPASFGKERDEAEKVGAKFRWPCFTKEITDQGVLLTDGELVVADTVVISIGDRPDLSFLSPQIEVERGFIKVDNQYRTSVPDVFAIGDAIRPGLLTDAIGAGRMVAGIITAMEEGWEPEVESRVQIDRSRISLEYFDPRLVDFDSTDQCGSQCASCGACRDCGICIAVCPQSAIRREDEHSGGYAYKVDPQRCIGCGFCAAACPCGVWGMKENTPLT